TGGERSQLAGPDRGPHRPRGRDPRADHPGQEQRRGRRPDLPQPEHGEVLHPHRLPQDRSRQPDAGGAVGRRARLHPRPPPHRPLARRPL
ncbi:MAG: Response regulator, partial [uncultured Friedmanniella sp.]